MHVIDVTLSNTFRLSNSGFFIWLLLKMVYNYTYLGADENSLRFLPNYSEFQFDSSINV